MAEAGDILEEFHKAKTPEKVVIVVAVVAIGGIAIYLIWNRNQASAGSAAGAVGASSSQQQAGYPTAGGVPVLPSGVNPLFDPNGNLIGFQNPATPTSGSGSGQTQPTTSTLNWFQQAFGLKPEISQQNGQFLLVERGGPSNSIQNVVNLKTLFPTGTTFSGGSGGYAYATIPGQTTPFVLTQGGYGRPTLTPSNTQVARTAGGH